MTDPVAKAPASPATETSVTAPGDGLQPVTADVIQSLRAARAKRIGLRILLLVVLPTVLATLYYGFVASPQFESHARFVVHASHGRVRNELTSIAPVGTSAAAAKKNKSPANKEPGQSLGQVDILAATASRDYLASVDLLKALDKELKILGHYRSKKVDYFSRLGRYTSLEASREYLDDKLTVDLDQTTGLLEVRARAFTRDLPARLLREALSQTEKQLNRAVQRELKSRVSVAEKAVVRSRETLTQLAGAPAPADTDYVRQIDLAEAEDSYRSALANVELEREELERQQRFVVQLVPPSSPDAAVYPKRLRSIGTVFVLTLLLMGIGTLLVSAVREHTQT